MPPIATMGFLTTFFAHLKILIFALKALGFNFDLKKEPKAI